MIVGAAVWLGRRARAIVLGFGLVLFVVFPVLRRRAGAPMRVLQAIAPTYDSPVGITVVSRHEDVAALLRNEAFGSDPGSSDAAQLKLGTVQAAFARRRRSSPEEPFPLLVRNLMLFKDGPEHARVRGLVAKAFTPASVDRLRARVEVIVDDLLGAALAADSVEFMSAVAYPLPARVICELLGIEPSDQALFVRHAASLAAGLDFAPLRSKSALAAANDATIELGAYLDGAIARRRAAPTSDLLSALVEHEGESGFSHEELVSNVLLLVLAGHETTATVLGRALVRMLRDRRLRQWLEAADERQMRGAVEEFLRLDGPVQIVQRIALRPTVVRNAPVRPGKVFVLSLAAANRDPRVFAKPATFDGTRTPNPHVAFGAGAHFCLGARLARLELQIALDRLVHRLPEQARLASRPRPRTSYALSGLQSVPISWSTR